MEFVKLIRVNGYQFTIRTDDIEDIDQLFTNRMGINSRYILTILAGTDKYHVDLDRLVSGHNQLVGSANIHELIAAMTPAMLYSNLTGDFHFNHPIRTFTSEDLPAPVTVTPYNHKSGVESNTSYDRRFPDLLIKHEGYDLTKTFPIVDGKVKTCIWRNTNITIPGAVDLTRSIESLGFISFAGINITVTPLKTLIDGGGNLIPGTIPILVLGGSLFYDNPFVYRFLHDRGKFELNQAFLDSEYYNAGYASADDWVNDPDSFVIEVEADNVYMREIPLVSIPSKHPPAPYCYHADGVWDLMLDHICLDTQTCRVRNLTKVTEQYQRVINPRNHREYHVYVTGPADRRAHLIQLLVC